MRSCDSFRRFYAVETAYGTKDSQTILEALVRDNILDLANTELRDRLIPDHFMLEVFRDNIYGGATEDAELKVGLEVLAEKMSYWNLKIGSGTVGTTSVPILGFQVSADGLTAVESNLKKIREFAEPLNRKQVRKFLGLTGF